MEKHEPDARQGHIWKGGRSVVAAITTNLPGWTKRRLLLAAG